MHNSAKRNLSNGKKVARHSQKSWTRDALVRGNMAATEQGDSWLRTKNLWVGARSICRGNMATPRQPGHAACPRRRRSGSGSFPAGSVPLAAHRIMLVWLFLCFRKPTQEIFSELDETKAEPAIFTKASQKPKMRWRGARGQTHHRVARPSPWSRHHMVRPGGPPPDATLSSIKSPRREKPKGRIAFYRNILQAIAVVEARSGGSRSSSRHLAGEGNTCRRPSPPPWSPLE
jgi:hypothetical protein